MQGIVLVGAAGAAFEFLHASDLSNFNLDDEWTIPALFSSLLLLAAAAELFRLHRIWQDRFLSVSSAFCGLLVFAAVDEGGGTMNGFETRLEIDWQLPYLPAFLVAALLWGRLLVRLWRHRTSRVLFVASGAAGSCPSCWKTWNGIRPIIPRAGTPR